MSDYCDKYCLTVNLKKTKIVVFCKNSSKSVQTFLYKNHVIERETTYKYLGIVFSSSGTFTNCLHDLYKRALKAYFKLFKSFGNIKPSVHTLIHLFDHTIKPILLYACEIWGTINTDVNSTKHPNYCLDNFFNKMYCEKLHVKFLKYVSGVHKKACNQSVVGELGRFPMFVDIIKCNLKYLQRI